MATREELLEVVALVKQRAFWKLLGFCVVVVGTVIEVVRPGVMRVVDWIVVEKTNLENANKLNAQQLDEAEAARRLQQSVFQNELDRVAEQLVKMCGEHVRFVAATRKSSPEAVAATLNDYLDLVQRWPCNPHLDDRCFTPEVAARKALAVRRPP